MTERARMMIAVLFYQAEPVAIRKLSQILKCTEQEIVASISDVETILKETGLCLVSANEALTLCTTPEASVLIETIAKEELSKELSKAALETLAIVLYKGPITRSEIDYIRGVNSNFILRNLLIRGLIEKEENPLDQRSYRYTPTFKILEYMGITKREELPSYHDTIASLGNFVASQTTDEVVPPERDVDTTVNSSTIPLDSPDALDDAEEEIQKKEDDTALLDAIEDEDEAYREFDDELLHEHSVAKDTQAHDSLP